MPPTIPNRQKEAGQRSEQERGRMDVVREKIENLREQSRRDERIWSTLLHRKNGRLFDVSR